MDPHQHRISVQRTAHYYTLGRLDTNVQYLWFVLHGYGQTADRIVQKFSELPPHHAVVAPEALSKFYWHEGERRPVASWMTSRHRLDEIGDYLEYLRQVHAHVTAPMSKAKTIVFGFSQGSATAARLAYAGDIDLEHLVIWAGDFPRDVDYLSSKSSPRIWHVLGDTDVFVTPQKYQEELEFVNKMGLPVEFITFSGGHRIKSDVLADLVRRISE